MWPSWIKAQAEAPRSTIDHQVSSVNKGGKGDPSAPRNEKNRAYWASGRGNGSATKVKSRRVGSIPLSSNICLLSPHFSRSSYAVICNPFGTLAISNEKSLSKKFRLMAHNIPISPGDGGLFDPPPVAKNAATSGLVDTSSSELGSLLYGL